MKKDRRYPMINQEEYEVLRNYYFRGIMWISRNENGNLVVSKIRPDKFERKWLPQCPDEDWSELRNSETYLFSFIQWEDKEPYEIAELIEEYESKEKEVKKREMIANIKSLAREVSQEWPHEEMVELRYVLREVSQLDEPEVPKQELPVIPKYVADFIEETKKQNRSMVFAITHIYDKHEIGESPTREESRIFIWMELGDNEEVFARAWLDGYTVAEEPLYTARLKVITSKYLASHLCMRSVYGEKVLGIGNKDIHEAYRHLTEFTEHELKGLDIWDSDQWVVEEVEE